MTDFSEKFFRKITNSELRISNGSSRELKTKYQESETLYSNAINSKLKIKVINDKLIFSFKRNS